MGWRNLKEEAGKYNICDGYWKDHWRHTEEGEKEESANVQRWWDEPSNVEQDQR